MGRSGWHGERKYLLRHVFRRAAGSGDIPSVRKLAVRRAIGLCLTLLKLWQSGWCAPVHRLHLLKQRRGLQLPAVTATDSLLFCIRRSARRWRTPTQVRASCTPRHGVPISYGRAPETGGRRRRSLLFQNTTDLRDGSTGNPGEPAAPTDTPQFFPGNGTWATATCCELVRQPPSSNTSSPSMPSS